jgi:hypothetical protein
MYVDVCVGWQPAFNMVRLVGRKDKRNAQTVCIMITLVCCNDHLLVLSVGVSDLLYLRRSGLFNIHIKFCVYFVQMFMH